MAGAVFVISLTGCQSQTNGRPSAAVDPASSSTDTTTRSTSPSSGANEDLDLSNTALCDLLTADEAEKLGSSATGTPGNSTADGHPLCQWTQDTGLIVGFQKDVQSTSAQSKPGVTITPTTISGHRAAQSQEVDSVGEVCQIFIDITDRTMLSVSAYNRSGGEGKYVPCDVANDLANIVVPKVLEF